jgi:hypothetical protein
LFPFLNQPDDSAAGRAAQRPDLVAARSPLTLHDDAVGPTETASWHPFIRFHIRITPQPDKGRITRSLTGFSSKRPSHAAWQMATTRPTTFAGAAALLEYITVRPVTGLFELGEVAWHETAFRTVAAALVRLTGGADVRLIGSPLEPAG